MISSREEIVLMRGLCNGRSDIWFRKSYPRSQPYMVESNLGRVRGCNSDHRCARTFRISYSGHNSCYYDSPSSVGDHYLFLGSEPSNQNASREACHSWAGSRIGVRFCMGAGPAVAWLRVYRTLE